MLIWVSAFCFWIRLKSLMLFKEELLMYNWSVTLSWWCEILTTFSFTTIWDSGLLSRNVTKSWILISFQAYRIEWFVCSPTELTIILIPYTVSQQHIFVNVPKWWFTYSSSVKNETSTGTGRLVGLTQSGEISYGVPFSQWAVGSITYFVFWLFNIHIYIYSINN